MLADAIADFHARSRGTYGILRVKAALELEQGLERFREDPLGTKGEDARSATGWLECRTPARRCRQWVTTEEGR
jgi:hypothetical protein